jgi:hypothetical protein
MILVNRARGALALYARRLIAFRLGRHRQLPAFPFSELIAQPAYTPVQRFECGLAPALAWLGARMVRYASPLRLSHSLLHAGLSRR